jgi:hypothetical protein
MVTSRDALLTQFIAWCLTMVNLYNIGWIGRVQGITCTGFYSGQVKKCNLWFCSSCVHVITIYSQRQGQCTKCASTATYAQTMLPTEQPTISPQTIAPSPHLNGVSSAHTFAIFDSVSLWAPTILFWYRFCFVCFVWRLFHTKLQTLELMVGYVMIEQMLSSGKMIALAQVADEPWQNNWNITRPSMAVDSWGPKYWNRVLLKAIALMTMLGLYI